MENGKSVASDIHDEEVRNATVEQCSHLDAQIVRIRELEADMKEHILPEGSLADFLE